MYFMDIINWKIYKIKNKFTHLLNLDFFKFLFFTFFCDFDCILFHFVSLKSFFFFFFELKNIEPKSTVFQE